MEITKDTLELLYKDIKAAIFIVDVLSDDDFCFIYFNPGCEEIFDFKISELINKRLNNLSPAISHDSIEIIRQHYMDCISANKTIEYKETIVHNEEKRFFNTTLTPLKNSDGKIYRIIGNSVPVTKHNKPGLPTNNRENFLIQHKAIKNILDSFPAVLYIVDPKTYEVIYVSKVFQSMLDKDPVGGKCYKEFQGFDTPCSFCTNDKIMKNNGEPYCWQHYNKLLDRHFFITDQMIEWIDGRKVRYEVAIDITEQKKIEKALKESETRFIELVDRAPIPLCYVSDNGKIINVNSRFLLSFGYSREEIPSLKEWWELAYPDPEYRKWVIKTWDDAVRRSVETGEDIIPVEYNVTCRNGNVKVMQISGIGMEGYFLATFIDMTELRKVEELLIESKERIELATSAANAGIWDWLIESNEVYYSPEWKKLIGYKDSELENKFSTWESLLHPDDRERMSNQVKNYLTDPKGQFFAEFRMQHKNGSYRWISNRAESVKDENGRVIRMFGAHTDITDLKKKEEELQEQRKRYYELFEQSPVSIWEEDWSEVIEKINKFKKEVSFDFQNYLANHPEWVNEALNSVKILDVNQETLRMFKAESKNEMLSSLNTVFATPDTLPGFIKELEALYFGKKIYKTEMKLNTVKGDTVDTLLIMFFPAGESDSTRVIVSLMDITELNKAREEVNKFFTVSLDLLCVANINGYFTKLNPSWTEVLGYSQKELMSKPFIEFIHPDDVALTLAEVQKLKTGITTLNFVNRYRCKNGTYKWLNWSVVPVGDTLYSAARDITDLKLKESELRNKTLELERNNRKLRISRTSALNIAQDLKETNDNLNELKLKLERSNKDLEQFAYVASHDLQEPLRMVSSFLQLLVMEYEDRLDDEAKSYIDFAVDGANRMKKLIQDLLSFSRIGTKGKPFSMIEIRSVIETVIINLDTLIKETDAVISYDITTEKVYGDNSQLLQLFQNLVGNAIKFRAKGRKPEIYINCIIDEDHLIISIKDNGIGIKKEFYERIFVIFQRLNSRKEYEGTGIGLAVCKKIVERHGGTISIQSEEGKGTEFIIKFPNRLKKLQ